jgi:hypothetical protein
MPKKANDISKAGAIEGIRWYFSNERPPGPPPKPFWLTYVGDDVVSVKGIGLFQNGTRAEVGPATAERYRGQPDWVVEERPRPKAEEDDAGESPDAPADPPAPAAGDVAPADAPPAAG